MAPVHDPDLLDALEELVEPWSGHAWRQMIGDLDPTRPNVRGARWNPAGVEALYFSLTAGGAEAELAKVLSASLDPFAVP